MPYELSFCLPFSPFLFSIFFPSIFTRSSGHSVHKSSDCWMDNRHTPHCLYKWMATLSSMVDGRCQCKVRMHSTYSRRIEYTRFSEILCHTSIHHALNRGTSHTHIYKGQFDTYSIHELSYNSIPCFGFRIVNAVHMIGHQAYGVLKAHLTGYSFQQINAKSFVACISR